MGRSSRAVIGHGLVMRLHQLSLFLPPNRFLLLHHPPHSFILSFCCLFNHPHYRRLALAVYKCAELPWSGLLSATRMSTQPDDVGDGLTSWNRATAAAELLRETFGSMMVWLPRASWLSLSHFTDRWSRLHHHTRPRRPNTPLIGVWKISSLLKSTFSTPPYFSFVAMI